MATGKQAFSGTSSAAIFHAILGLAPTSPLSLNPRLPPKLEEIVNKALEKDRNLRYQHAADLHTDLKRLKRDTDSGRVGAGLVLGLSPADTLAAQEGHPRGVPLQIGHPQEPAPIPQAREKGVPLRRWPSVLAATVLVLLAGAAIAWFVTRHPEPQKQLTERQLTANPTEDWVTSAAISPDGKHIAYRAQTGLYIRSIDSGETHAVSLPEGFRNRINGLQWFPDGGKLLAGVCKKDGGELWAINLLGEAAPHLLNGDAAQPAISPDGRLLAFSRGDPMTLWVSGINGEAPRKLGEDGQFVVSPAWSPDGRWIAYVSWKAASEFWNPAIEVRPAGGGPAKTLVTDSILPKAGPCAGPPSPCLQWLPDWRLLFTARQAAG